MAEEVLADVGRFGYLFLGGPLYVGGHERKIVRNVQKCQQKSQYLPKICIL
jgi:hypothetical protein